ncbi:hypothetical protein, partial [Bradyrhizobium denitrificans]
SAPPSRGDSAAQDSSQKWSSFPASDHTSGIPTRTGNVLSVLYSKQYYEAFQNDPLAQLPGRISDLDYEDSPTAASILLVRVTSADWKAADINRQSTRLPPDQFKRLIDHMKSNGRL